MQKTIAVLAVLAIAGVAAVSETSCTVHRRSDELACTVDADCLKINGGTCDRGYCVSAASGCPSPCTSCDLTDLTCEVQCNTGAACGAVRCPPGFDCTIQCSNASCGDIDCALARHCKIECAGAAACGRVNCGPGACDISCSGPGACPAIDCAASCQCDVSCNSSGAACPSMACPIVPITDQLCTRQGSAGANCDSSPPGCDTCPDF